MRRSFTAVLGAVALTVTALMASPTTASAEPGDLDGIFGGCGLAAIRLLPSYRTWPDRESSSGSPPESWSKSS